MKSFSKIALLSIFLILALLALPATVNAQGPVIGGDSPVVFGGYFELAEGNTIKDLVVFGGSANLRAGSTVTGNVVVFGGSLEVGGEVQGDVTAFGGTVRLTDSAVIDGDLSNIGGTPSVSQKAIIRGKQNFGVGNLPSINFPSRLFTNNFWVDFGPTANILWNTFLALIVAALAVLAGLFLPRPTTRVAQTIAHEPVISGAMGLLTLIIAPALLVVLFITLILIPLGLLGIIVMAVAILFGWIAIGLDIGNRLAALFKAEWPVAVSAGVGTLLLSLLSNLLWMITGWFWPLCCITLPLFMVVIIVSLGGVVSSRFGTIIYSSKGPMVPPAQPPATPQPPIPPAYPQEPTFPKPPEPVITPPPTDNSPTQPPSALPPAE